MSPALLSHEPTALFDPDAVLAELGQLVTFVEGEPRTVIAQRLKTVLSESSAKAEALKGGLHPRNHHHGRRSAI